MGMSNQIGKGDVFTRDSLRSIQDKMRTLCIGSFNKKYGLNNILKNKETLEIAKKSLMNQIKIQMILKILSII